MDTFARVPTATLVRLHMDPEGPTPAVSASSILAELPAEGIDALLAATGPASDSKLTVMELRQLGGALAVPADGRRGGVARARAVPRVRAVDRGYAGAGPAR